MTGSPLHGILRREQLDFRFTEEQEEIQRSVRDLCGRYPDEYWRELDAERRYPEEFVRTLTESGWLAALIPEEYGGKGLGVTEAAIILEEINRSGANGGACHAQMYTMGTLLRHGSEEQKRSYLPKIATGELRLQAFGVTEHNAGTDTTRIETSAVRDGDHYIINGHKSWTSRARHSDLLLLLARTTPYEELSNKTEGLSTFLVDLSTPGIEVRPSQTMINYDTNEVFFRDVRVPAENLIGEEGKGFRYILDGMNVERILIASEAIGDGRWFVDRASSYATERVVFDRPIGQNQGVQFPIARAYASIEAASMVRFKAASFFDAGEKCGAEANMAKLLSSEATWEAANVAVQTYGGYGFRKDYDVERKFRETRIFMVAPVSNNLVLSYIGQHLLKMPRSY
jgi:acyl-CoA dehydrogenase